MLLLEALLVRLKEAGLVKPGGRQRSDSTHVLAAIRGLNRLETVGETLRAALNSLAEAVPAWLTERIAPDWFERYGRRVKEYRLPKGETARTALAERIGRDGHQILSAVYAPGAPTGLHVLPAVQTLRRTWVHQFYVEDEQVRWRTAAELPPAGQRHDSPYDVEARYANKRSVTWVGYKVHLTETCDAGAPHLITHVETTSAPVSDIDRTAPIHEALVARDLAPAVHFLDAGYVDAPLLLASQAEHGIEIVGPVRPDASWQGKTRQGYDLGAFIIGWDTRTVTCPQGQTATSWVPKTDHWGNAVIHIKFPSGRAPLAQRGRFAPRPRPAHGISPSDHAPNMKPFRTRVVSKKRRNGAVATRPAPGSKARWPKPCNSSTCGTAGTSDWPRRDCSTS